MKYIKIKYISLIIFLALQVVSCKQDDYPHLADGEGMLDFVFLHNAEENIVVKSESSLEPVFAVNVKEFESGVIIRSCNDHREYLTAPLTLKEGKYIIEATNGTDVNAAFDNPFYSGKDTVEVVEGIKITSEIITTLSNVKMSIFMSESVLRNFKSYVVTVTNKDGGILVYDGATLGKSGFFKCTGTLSWRINLINNNGTAFEVTEDITDVKPREHYKLHFGINEDGDKDTGGSSITVSYDESTNIKEYEINVSLNKKPAPILAGIDFDIDSPLMIQVNTNLFGKVKLTSAEGVKRVIISHESSIMKDLGLPDSFSVIGLETGQLSIVNSAGVSWGECIEGTVEVVFDFRVFLAKLPLGDHSIKFTILDRHAQYVESTFNIAVIPDVEVTTLSVDTWSKFAYLSGQWNTLVRPEGIAFEYKKVSDMSWTVVLGDLVVSEKKFSMKMVELEPNTTYQFRAVSMKDESNIISFTTEGAFQMANNTFDAWHKSGKHWYANQDLSAANYFWDSGNVGANSLSEKNPTSPETSHIVSGKAAKMASTTVMGVFAAGSIYYGKYLETVGLGAKLSFGRPFTSRPTQVKFHYDYKSGIVNKTKGDYGYLDGTADNCHIYAILTDWDGAFTVNTTTSTFVNMNDPKIIAFGELVSDQTTNGYREHTIDLEYRRDGVKPKYLVFVASASKYGDYFTGSTSSVLYLDEVKFIY